LQNRFSLFQYVPALGQLTFRRSAAERWASAAPGSRSEGRAKAGRRQLQADVRLWRAMRRWESPFLSLTSCSIVLTRQGCIMRLLRSGPSLRTLGECLRLCQDLRQTHGPKVLLSPALVIKGLTTD